MTNEQKRDADRFFASQFQKVEMKKPIDARITQVLEAGWERFKYEPSVKLPDEAQMIGGEWWVPKRGCDSLQSSIEELETILSAAPGQADLDKNLQQFLVEAMRGLEDTPHTSREGLCAGI